MTPSKQLPSCLSICLNSAFLFSLCQLVLFFSHLQVYPLYLVTNFATKKVVVLATSPLDTCGDQAELVFASMKLSENDAGG